MKSSLLIIFVFFLVPSLYADAYEPDTMKYLLLLQSDESDQPKSLDTAIDRLFQALVDDGSIETRGLVAAISELKTKYRHVVASSKPKAESHIALGPRVRIAQLTHGVLSQWESGGHKHPSLVVAIAQNGVSYSNRLHAIEVMAASLMKGSTSFSPQVVNTQWKALIEALSREPDKGLFPVYDRAATIWEMINTRVNVIEYTILPILLTMPSLDQESIDHAISTHKANLERIVDTYKAYLPEGSVSRAKAISGLLDRRNSAYKSFAISADQVGLAASDIIGAAYGSVPQEKAMRHIDESKADEIRAVGLKSVTMGDVDVDTVSVEWVVPYATVGDMIKVHVVLGVGSGDNRNFVAKSWHFKTTEETLKWIPDTK